MLRTQLRLRIRSSKTKEENISLLKAPCLSMSPISAYTMARKPYMGL